MTDRCVCVCVNVFRDIHSVFSSQWLTRSTWVMKILPSSFKTHGCHPKTGIASVIPWIDFCSISFSWYSHLRKGSFCSVILNWTLEMYLNVKWPAAHVLPIVDPSIRLGKDNSPHLFQTHFDGEGLWFFCPHSASVLVKMRNILPVTCSFSETLRGNYSSTVLREKFLKLNYVFEWGTDVNNSLGNKA